MLKLLVCAMLSTGLLDVAHAQTSLNDLPLLPDAEVLTQDDIGRQFKTSRTPEKAPQKLIYVGRTANQQAIAFSIERTPESRKTYQQTQQLCASFGPGWQMPTLDMLKMMTPHADKRDVSLLPGSYWSSTPAPCFDCRDPALFKMAYDIRTGNMRNSYATPVFKNYPLCAYQVPNKE